MSSSLATMPLSSSWQFPENWSIHKFTPLRLTARGRPFITSSPTNANMSEPFAMPGKLKLIFGDFLKSARKLWLEMMGALFLALAVMFSLNTIAAYRKTPIWGAWDWQTGFSIIGSAFFSILMLAFSLQSFWKARKIR